MLWTLVAFWWNIIRRSKSELLDIIEESEERFGGNFSEKLFLEQLTYLKDLEDFEVEFLKEKYAPEQIRDFLEQQVADCLQVSQKNEALEWSQYDSKY